MRAMKAVRVFVVVALIIALATPAFAYLQSVGLAIGLGGFFPGVGVGVLAGPVFVTPAAVKSAPSPVYSSPPPGVFYPSGNFYRPQPYGYYSQPAPYGYYYR